MHANLLLQIQFDRYASIIKTILSIDCYMMVFDPQEKKIWETQDSLVTNNNEIILGYLRELKISEIDFRVYLHSLTDNTSIMYFPIRLFNSVHVSWFVVLIGKSIKTDKENFHNQIEPAINNIVFLINNDLKTQVSVEELAQELSVRYDELNLFYELGVDSHDFDSYSQTCRKMLNVCDCYLSVNNSALYLTYENKEIYTSTLSELSVDQQDFMYPLVTTAYEVVKVKNKTIVLNSQNDKEKHNLFKNEKYKFVIAPLVFKEGIKGLLLLVNSTQAKDFKTSDKRLAETLASQLVHLISLYNILDKSNRLSRIIEQTPEIIIVTDPNGNIEYVNQAFQVHTGYKKNEVVGKKANVLKSDKHSDKFFKKLWNTINKGDVFHGTLTNSKKSGEHYLHEQSISAIKNHDGVIEHFVSSGRDITAYRQTEEVARKALRDILEVKVAHNTKNRFFANITHELKTPLNAIIGYSDLIKENLEIDSRDEYLPDLDKVIYASNQLLTMINEILDFSRIEAGTATLQYEEFDLNVVIFDLINTIDPIIKENKNTLELECNDKIGTLYSDELRVRQILYNLISRVSKVTTNSHIHLYVHKVDIVEKQELQDAAVPLYWIGFNIKAEQEITEDADNLAISIVSENSLVSANQEVASNLGLEISKRLVKALGGTLSMKFDKNNAIHINLLLPKI